MIATRNMETVTSFRNCLMNKFRMVDLNEMKLFLGIKVSRETGTITLVENAYIRSVLSKFTMYDCKPVATTLKSKVNYEALNSLEEYNASCRSLIGCMII